MSDLTQAAAVVDELAHRRRYHASDDVAVPEDLIERAMRSIFGAEADAIEVPHIDHLCMTLTPLHVEQLLRAAGGPWVELLERIAAKRSAAKAAKDPGPDPRFKNDGKLAAASASA